MSNIFVNQGALAATAVVAPSDCMNEAAANYVCDGTNDEVEIQAAIDAVDAVGGGKVFLLEGTYNLDGVSPVNFAGRDNIILSGAGRATILFCRNNAASEVIRGDQCTHIIVENLSIDFDAGVVEVNALTVAPSAGTAVEDITYRNIWINHALTALCIQFSDATARKILFENIIATNSYRQGAWFWADTLGSQDPDACEDVIVRNCEIDTVINDGAANVNGYGMLINAGKNCKLIDCVVKNAQKDGIHFAGLDAANPLEDIELRGCSVYDNGQGGGATTSDGIVINAFIVGFRVSGCRALDSRASGSKTQQKGISVAGPSCLNGVVSDNWCFENEDDGIHNLGTYITIGNNVCFLNEASGIQNEGDYCSICGNLCEENDSTGITLLAGNDCTIDGNVCFSNGIHGIGVNNSDDCVVSNNHCRLNGFEGINVLNSSRAIIEGNQVHESNQGNIGRDNIRIEGTCDDILIVDNLARAGVLANKPVYGVNISAATCTDVTVRDNDLRDAGQLAWFSINDLGVGSRIYRQDSEVFMDVLAASTNHCGSWAGTGAEQVIVAGITQPDVPRNLSVSCTNNAAPSGDVVIVGVNGRGYTVTETFTIIAGGTRTGNVAFATITSITIPATVLAADTVSVGIGSKLGLSNDIYLAAEVYKVKKNNADWPAASYTPDGDYDTVDVSVGGAINAGDDFTIWYRCNLNLIT